MKKAVYTVVLLDCIYIAVASLATLLSFIPYLSLAVRYAAFLIPIVILVFLIKGGEYDGKINLLPDREGLLLTLPFAVPSVLLVMGISFLTSLLMSLFNAPVQTPPSFDFFGAFTLHALLPAVGEELIFRFIPLVLLAPHSKKSAVVISTLLFAFVHGDPYQIPYAIVAGAVYMALTVATDSVIPSIILHLFNNTVAILWQGVLVPGGLWSYALCVMGVLLLVSAIAVWLMREKYKSRFSFFADKTDRVELPVILIAPIGIGIILAFTSML